MIKEALLGQDKENSSKNILKFKNEKENKMEHRNYDL